ncbi:hypothetical protein SynROS8604_00138 [Synechococcus sp. ROS8604]|nr:hypothetical protein SynROS8604_00138 [Synechococcus sp. ROS8604]
MANWSVIKPLLPLAYNNHFIPWGLAFALSRSGVTTKRLPCFGRLEQALATLSPCFQAPSGA